MSEGQKYKKAIEKALKQFDGVDVDSDEFGYAIYPASDIREVAKAKGASLNGTGYY